MTEEITKISDELYCLAWGIMYETGAANKVLQTASPLAKTMISKEVGEIKKHAIIILGHLHSMSELLKEAKK